VGLVGDLKAVGERPPPPWHPLPLSELLIFVGVVGVVIAMLRGPESNGALLAAAIAAVVIGTVEVAVREHMSGFRPHTTLLAVIPAIVFYSAVVLVAAAVGGAPRWLDYVLLPIAVAIVAICFKLLRARYADARRARTAAAGR
jgi:drug/metabolite transporter (DMT)-like permease